ncbi:PIN/TRAM domain-containing protein [uncultured Veillonella sp.]|uniref:PIN/TRAM domain-containing protein n=1 Tax=uncultured Veillonella sp. TaxID=159268 RepID=UPI0025F55298|nr:PIN domain-containing protein [uncultured Veillonella sp.]MDY3973313.1 PIN/TRAM domain-containing protein [Veillonella caviae]
MVYKILRYVIALLVGIMGYVLTDNFMPVLEPIIDVKFWNAGFLGISFIKILALALGGMLGAVVGYIISMPIINQGLRLARNLERLLSRVPSQDLMAGTAGLLFGLIIANLIGLAFHQVPIIGSYIPIILSAIFGYIGMRLASNKGPELYNNWLQNRVLSRDKKKDTTPPKAVAEAPVAGEFESISAAKLLDTSVIIDGRIAELCSTGFLEGPLVVPLFVLEELQFISDSSDVLKRNRGRRGLDILQSMQQKDDLLIKVIDDDYEDINEVDSKLMRLAMERKWKIITNDFNLNKVASLQGISVLNLNELANALKPAMIPGEWIRVQVIKEGKEDNQGVAYLDDGTMIVIENGAEYVDTSIDVMVTSVLQTSAGRMIFARAKGHKE